MKVKVPLRDYLNVQGISMQYLSYSAQRHGTLRIERSQCLIVK